MQAQIASEREEWTRKRREMQGQLDSARAELDVKEIECAELKDRLRRKEDDNAALRADAHGLERRIHDGYKLEIDAIKEDNARLKEEMKQMA